MECNTSSKQITKNSVMGISTLSPLIRYSANFFVSELGNYKIVDRKVNSEL